MSTSSTRRLPLVATTFLALLGSSCSDAPPEALAIPAKSDDLYTYCLAVAERAKRMVPAGRALPIFNLAHVHRRFGKDDMAVDLNRQGLAIDPTHAPAYQSIGRYYSLTNRGAEALRELQMSLQHQPNSPGTWSTIGIILVHMDRYDEAIEALEVETRAGTATPSTWYTIGLAHKSLERWPEAAAAYRKALEIDGKHREAVHSLAEALRMIGKKEEAKKYGDLFRELKTAADAEEQKEQETPTKTDKPQQIRFTAETWHDAAIVFLTERNRILVEHTSLQKAGAEVGKEHDHSVHIAPEDYIAHAVDALDRAIEFDPAYRSAHELRIDIFSTTRSPEHVMEARRLASRALPDDPDLSLQLARAIHSSLDGRNRNDPALRPVIAEARQALERALGHVPDHVGANYLLADLIVRYHGKLSTTDVARAITAARKAIDNTPSPNPSHYFVLAGAHARGNNVPAAFQAIDEGLKRVVDPAGRRFLAKQRAKMEGNYRRREQTP